MSPEGVKQIKYKEILRYEEIARIVEIATSLGVRKIRITGGEPIARKNITYLISSLSSMRRIEDISLTTNGMLLERYADELAQAGLDRVNISLDSLKHARFADITRGGTLKVVLRGIERAERAGLVPIKINMVPIKGFNHDEIGEFSKITLTKPYQVRFIEFMPIGPKEMWRPDKYIPIQEIKKLVEKTGKLFPAKKKRSGPAHYFRFEGAPGVIGFINAISNQFCRECNRLRLTADGKLRPCLFSETEIDLKTPLRSGARDSEIKKLLKLSVEVKPEGHNLSCRSEFTVLKPMSRIGG
jgi:cyclic pyranopterin phosphate synthase